MSVSPADPARSPVPAARRPVCEHAKTGRRLPGGLGLLGAGTAVPVVPGIVMAAGARTGITVLAAVATVVIVAVAGMYRSRQETRRTEIEWHSVNAVADALAACISNVHHSAAGLPCGQEAAEAEHVRSSARSFLAGPGAAVLTRLSWPANTPDPQPPRGQRRLP